MYTNRFCIVLRIVRRRIINLNDSLFFNNKNTKSLFKVVIEKLSVSSSFSPIFFYFHFTNTKRISNFFQTRKLQSRRTRTIRKLPFLQRSISSIKFLTNTKKGSQTQRNKRTSLYSSSSFLHIPSNEISQFPSSLQMNKKSKTF